MCAVSARVLLIGRSTLLGDTLAGIIESAGMTVAAAVPPTPAALELLRGLDATFAVIETNGNVPDTAALLCRVQRVAPVPFVVIGPPATDGELVQLIEAGCCGYVDRDAGVRDLVEALEHASQRHAIASPRLLALVASRIRTLAKESANDGQSAPLTARELQVLTLAARGITNKEIAQELGIWVQTVKSHLHNIYEKLEVRSRREAIARAVRRGLLHE